MSRHVQLSDPLQSPSHWWHRWHLSTQKFAVLLCTAAVATGFSYVLLTNHTAAAGFAIKQLQNQITSLRDQNEKLELQAADLRSLSVVQNSSSELGLVPVDKFEYLGSASGTVAVK